MTGRLQRTINIVENTPLRGESKLDLDLKSVNTTTFMKKKKKLVEILSKVETSYLDKFKILNFFCNKLVNIYRLNEHMSVLLTDSLYNVVYNGNTLPISIRLYYMRFQNEKISFNASIRLYENSIRENLEHIPYFQILKYILRNSRAYEDIRNTIMEEFEALFTNPVISRFIKMEIADIFLLNNRVERGNEMLDILRGFIRVTDAKDIKTVYDDSQNVHDARVNESVLTASHRLIELFSETDFDRKEILETLQDIDQSCTDVVNDVIDRIEIDTARFSHGDDRFSLYNVFSNLWVFITRHKQQDELKTRLLEELNEMHSYCSTGHLSRLINVIQGYTEDPKLCIKISEQSQIKAVVSVILEKILSNAPEDVMDSMIGDQTLFAQFIVNEVNKKLPKLMEEYARDSDESDVKGYILLAIISYTRYEDFGIVDNTLVIKKKEE